MSSISPLARFPRWIPWLALCIPLAGCKSGRLEGVVAAVDEDVSTVIDVSWTTEDEGTSYVEFGQNPELFTRSTHTSEASTSHAFQLYGLPSLTTVYYRAVTEVDGEERSYEGEITTGGLPGDLPEIEVMSYDASLASDAEYAMLVTMGTPSTLLMVNRAGRILWYRELTSIQDGEDESYFYSDIQFAHDSNDILYNAYSLSLFDYRGYVRRVSLGGEVEEEHDTDQGHHAFVEHEDGTIGYLAADVREWELPGHGMQAVAGDTIVEIDPEGNQETVFTVWDWAEPSDHEYWDLGYYQDAMDWTHGNSLEYCADSQTYLLSLGFVNAVLEVDRTTGEVTREFGPAGIWVDDQSLPFKFQHSVNWTDDDTLLLFSSNQSEDESWAVEYEVDGDELHEIWSYGELEGLYSYAEGVVHRLDNGNTLVAWTTAGTAREVTPEGEVAWEVQVDVGSTLLGTKLFDDFYVRE